MKKRTIHTIKFTIFLVFAAGSIAFIIPALFYRVNVFTVLLGGW